MKQSRRLYLFWQAQRRIKTDHGRAGARPPATKNNRPKKAGPKTKVNQGQPHPGQTRSNQGVKPARQHARAHLVGRAEDDDVSALHGGYEVGVGHHVGAWVWRGLRFCMARSNLRLFRICRLLAFAGSFASRGAFAPHPAQACSAPFQARQTRTENGPRTPTAQPSKTTNQPTTEGAQ